MSKYVRCLLSFFCLLSTMAYSENQLNYLYAGFNQDGKREWKTLEEITKETLSAHSGNEHAHHGMIEISAYSQKKQTAEQKAAALKLLEQVKQAALKHNWFSYKKAVADGYSPSSELDQVHFANKKFLMDDELLNPNKPEFLMFYKTDKGMLLAGVMFVVKKQLDHGPQPGGNETVWHFHQQPNTCWENMLPAGIVENGKCVKGKIYHQSPEMLHVWIADHPEGKFATNMVIMIDGLLKNEFITSRADKN